MDDDEETTATRFTRRLLKHFLKGFEARDKNVRYRVVCFVAEVISQLGELEYAVFLLYPVHYKHSSSVRICTTPYGPRYWGVSAIKSHSSASRQSLPLPRYVAPKILRSSGRASKLPQKFSRTCLHMILPRASPPTSTPFALPNELLSDVRRAALLNIPITAQTLPTVLTRTRDVDTTVRRLVYGSVLLAHADLPDDAMPGAAHPRALTIAQREQIVRNGLGDREPAVRAAAGKFIGAWVDAVSVGTKKGPALEDLLAFLGTFDPRESAAVEDALLSVFVMRIDVFDALEFDGAHFFSSTSSSHTI